MTQYDKFVGTSADELIASFRNPQNQGMKENWKGEIVRRFLDHVIMLRNRKSQEQVYVFYNFSI